MKHSEVIKIVAKNTGLNQESVKEVFQTYEKVLKNVLAQGDDYLWSGMFSMRILANTRTGNQAIFQSLFKANTKRLKIKAGCRLARSVGIIPEADKKRYYRLRQKVAKK